MFKWLFSFFRKAPKKKFPVIPRVRVLDNELNRSNNHWKALIGEEGIFLGFRVDEEGEIWDVKLDNVAVPHQMIKKERFEMLPGRPLVV